MDRLYEVLNAAVTFFPLQVFIAMSLFAFRFPRRSLFFLRYAGALTLFTAATWFIPNLIVYGWFDLKYIVICTISALFLFPCFKTTPKELTFCAMAGYSVQHIGFGTMMIVLACFLQADRWLWMLLYAACFAAVYVVCTLVFARRVRPGKSKNLRNWRLLLLVGITIFVTQVLSLWLNAEMPLEILPRVYAIGGSVLVLIVQFDFFHESELEQNNRIVEQLLQQRNEQFALSKENIDVINLKCHDLKKNIDLLLSVGDKAAQETLKKELAESVMIYDSGVQTGNEAVDVLIMDRSIYCSKNNIKFSYIVDGALLSFMNTADVFSLVGNILDNCIECELHEAEDSRLIALRIVERGGCVYVHAENFCSAAASFSADGLPLTTKQDKNMHGFGTQSIRYIAERYGGTVKMYQEDGFFNVDVLFVRRAKAA